jgi:tetratricopeptide (TPR) repeat protein
MQFSDEDIFKLQQLLLHKGQENVQLALSMLAGHEKRLPSGLIAALNMVSHLSPITSSRTAAVALLSQQSAFSTKRRRLDMKTLGNELALFVIARANQPLAWRRAYRRFEQYRHIYEPLFLMYPHWQRVYREVLKLFYLHGELRYVISYCDALLTVLPDDFFLNNYRFNSVNFLLEQGEAYDELHNQEKWLRRWHQLYPNTDCMIYTLLGQLYSQFHKDKTAAIAHYRTALNYKGKVQWDNYAAMAANNLAVILTEEQQELAEAYDLVVQANQWSPQVGTYRETLAYLQWKHLKDTRLAESNFLLALDLEPHNLAAAANLALLYLELELTQKAKTQIKYILNFRNPDPKYSRYTRPALATYTQKTNDAAIIEQIETYLKYEI